MKIIDLHCDTLDKLAEVEGSELKENIFSVDINKLKKSNYLAQFFALFVDRNDHPDIQAWALELVRIFKKEMLKNSDSVKQAFSYSDILENENKGLISSVLTIEEGAVIQGDLENLKGFYELGVRLITLTWNYPNEIGYPNYLWKYSNEGLTDFGLQLIDAMNEMGIIIDVSHLSDRGFYDVAARSRAPFIASHSNARSITNNPRNLTDDMIKILADRGGLTGLNFFSGFLGEYNIATVEDMVKHVKHIYKIGGIDVLALGSDFDGISTPVEFEDCSKMDVLYNSLIKNGFSEDEADKIFYKNALRVIKEVMKNE
ncbi:dipeptidase [Clostridium thermarum]|uniref:dipeptidase n=1 Tax=Clostridium thermarum TaxID=1716543 RepID=UPI001122051D|nr:dipeptidase [Clostridium thermarum]